MVKRISIFLFFFLLTGLLPVKSVFCEEKGKDPFLSTISTASEEILKKNQKYIQRLQRKKQDLKNLINPDNNFFSALYYAESLLIFPDENFELFEKNLKNLVVLKLSIRSELKKIENEVLDLEEEKDELSQRILLISEKIDLRKETIDSGRSFIFSLELYQSIFQNHLDTIIEIIDVFTEEQNIYKNRLERTNDIEKRLKIHIGQIDESSFFRKGNNVFSELDFGEIKNEYQKIKDNTKGFFSRDYKEIFLGLYKNINLVHLIIIFVFASYFFVKNRIEKRLLELKGVDSFLCSRQGFLVNLFKGCFTHLVFLGFIHILLFTKIYIALPSLLNFLKDYIFILLFTKIASDTILIILRDTEVSEKDFFIAWKRFFTGGIRLYCFIYFSLFWFFGAVSSLLPAVRIIVELVFCIGVMFFWRLYFQKGFKFRFAGIGAAYLSTGIVLSGLVADFAGFSNLASHWYVSWGLTFVVICVSFVFFYSLDEIDKSFKEDYEPESRKSHGVSYPVYWIASRWIYLVAVFFAVSGIAWAWGFFEGFFRIVLVVFNREFGFAGLNLKISSFFYSLLFLTGVHFFVKFFREIVETKILSKTGLDEGVSSSITAISVYLIWGGGILISFNIIGLNTTSLAVGFGALGVGIGFGLQNIFNNFISGLILLFERPVKVGDVIEVKGLFGIVEKINVRSTIVQTYDNSSIIIPNSELISAQVTNWTHKDKYIRRDVVVSVAYGTDVELVKELLIGATEVVTEIGYYPQKPEVLFMDFGESSLNFKIRFWSNLDLFLKAESNLRFEVERIFRENNIIIPFPQRDIHIISSTEKIDDNHGEN